MPPLTSGFLFALTNAGAERILRAGVAVEHPAWRLSYQQRGFVTFKAPDDAPFTLRDIRVNLPFARRLCLSLGKAPDAESAIALLHQAAGNNVPLHHIRLEKGQATYLLPACPAPPSGEPIGTLVSLSDTEHWAGIHHHAPLLSPDPGGWSGLVMPEDSPSRAWLKLEEATRFFGLKFTPRDIVVELGCAPGGVLLALLRRGISCIGVDPARLAPIVMTSAVPEFPPPSRREPWVIHCRKPAALVGKKDLGGVATWFMSDMNQSPAVAIKECGRFIRMCPSIRSALITLKLTDLTESAEKPLWLQSLRDMGFRTVRLQQFSVHHRELALLGLDRVDTKP